MTHLVEVFYLGQSRLPSGFQDPLTGPVLREFSHLSAYGPTHRSPLIALRSTTQTTRIPNLLPNAWGLSYSEVHPEMVARAIPAATPEKQLTSTTRENALGFRGYIAEFDGFRGIAVSLVILHHMWPWGDRPHSLFIFVQLAWMLMDVFFVLSGFLIAGILLDTRQRPDYYKTFYIRRALRILPIYYLVLIALTAIAMLRGHDAYRETLAHWGSLSWFFVYLGNMPTAISGIWPTAAGGAFNPLWSLQIEEQFYLFFPLLVHRLGIKSLTRVLVALCCFSPLLRLALYWQLPSNELIQYVFTPCRFEGLALGALIAIRFRQRPWIVNRRFLTRLLLGCGALVAGLCFYYGGFHTQPFNRTFGLLLSPLLATLFVFWVIQFRESKATAFLRFRPFQYLGKVSYAAYLIHWPVANLITVALAHIGLPSLDTGVSRLALIYAATFGLCALSWHFFEKPILGLKNRIGNQSAA